MLALLGSGSMSYYYIELFMPRVLEVRAASNLASVYAFGQDFYPVWLTSRECIPKGCDPYSPEMTRKIQRGLFGRTLDSQFASDPPTNYRTFAYPAFTDLLLWPAAQFSFATARVVIAWVLAGLTSVSVFLWMQALCWRPRPSWLAAIVLVVLCSYPVLEGLYVDQLGLLVGFLLAASLFALQRGWPLVAGAVMALTMIKPQMTMLAVIYLLVWSLHHWREGSRFCIGLASSLAVLIGSATLVWPHWIQSWARVLLEYHHYAKLPLTGEIFNLGLNRGGTASLAAIALFLTLMLSWKMRKVAESSNQFWLTLSSVLCITAITLLPSQGFHDQVILLPCVFLVSLKWKELSPTWVGKALLLTATGVLLWPWFAAFALIVLRPLVTRPLFYSKTIFVLPLRTAAVFPFVLLGVLALGLRRSQPSLP